jgi:hypothetical protein
MLEEVQAEPSPGGDYELTILRRCSYFSCLHTFVEIRPGLVHRWNAVSWCQSKPICRIRTELHSHPYGVTTAEPTIVGPSRNED